MAAPSDQQFLQIFVILAIYAPARPTFTRVMLVPPAVQRTTRRTKTRYASSVRAWATRWPTPRRAGLVAHVRCALDLRPDAVLVSLDVLNAYDLMHDVIRCLFAWASTCARIAPVRAHVLQTRFNTHCWWKRTGDARM